MEELLARIGGNTYLMDATRRLTMTALDMGEKPSVISAICKYHMTERMRSILNDAMDIHGGKGIMMGPNNYLGSAYINIPLAITVEGANALAAFDRALWGHMAFTISNAARSLGLGFTGGEGVSVPAAAPETRRYL